MTMNLDGFWWLLLTLGPLLIIQPRLHEEIQALFLVISRRSDIAMLLFSVVFFPGILLHELSHFLMAKLLGVETGRFSLAPKDLKNGLLQLGFVEIGAASQVKEALIGAAPLLVGSSFVAYAGLAQLEFDLLWGFFPGGDTPALLDALVIISRQPDFWVWLYLTMAVSSTMMPSASDRKAWGPILIFMGLGVVLVLMAGLGGWFLETFGAGLNSGMRAAAVVIGIALLAHVVTLLPVMLIKRLVMGMMGVEVVGER